MLHFTALTATAAVLAGLTTSVHCFAMCGPLACAGCARATPAGHSRARVMSAYHLSRIISYTLVGALFGLLGEGAMLVFTVVAPKWLPWVLVAFLVAAALGLGEWAPRIPVMSQILRGANRVSAALSPTARAGTLGALTPLLPCGLLYALFGTALLTGSAGGGAQLAAGFALGGAPALTLAQLQTSWIRRLPASARFLIQRAIPLTAALVLAWRATSTSGCPLCPQ